MDLHQLRNIDFIAGMLCGGYIVVVSYFLVRTVLVPLDTKWLWLRYKAWRYRNTPAAVGEIDWTQRLRVYENWVTYKKELKTRG